MEVGRSRPLPTVLVVRVPCCHRRSREPCRLDAANPQRPAASLGLGSTGSAEATAAFERIKARRIAFQDALTAASRITLLLSQADGENDTERWRVEEERRNECVGRFEGYLRRLGVLTEQIAEEAKAEAAEAMRRGIAAAEAEPPPDPELLFERAYVDPPPNLREGWLG